jgi:hypothetical protein
MHRELPCAAMGARQVSAGSFAAAADGIDAVSFNLNVAGEPAGSAIIEIDAHGLPVNRRQSVRFLSGEMRVVEQYSAFFVDR